MFSCGPLVIFAILAIVLLIFVPKRLKNLGSELGGAIKGFRKSIGEEKKEGNVELKTIDAKESKSNSTADKD